MPLVQVSESIDELRRLSIKSLDLQFCKITSKGDLKLFSAGLLGSDHHHQILNQSLIRT